VNTITKVALTQPGMAALVADMRKDVANPLEDCREVVLITHHGQKRLGMPHFKYCTSEYQHLGQNLAYLARIGLLIPRYGTLPHRYRMSERLVQLLRS
jgi:hypothetical protein